MRILFLTQTASYGPASRYRVYQYLDYLKKKGVNCKVSPAIPNRFYTLYNKLSNPWLKIPFFILVIFKRILDLFRIHDFDIVFIQREILPQGYPVFEGLIHLFGKTLIFDFDDAIFLIPPKRSNILYLFRCRRSIERIIGLSRLVIAGNSYLGEYALKFNPRTEVIPTCIDTDKFCVQNKQYVKSDKFIVGWIGSPHTLFYLEPIKEVLRQISSRYNIRLLLIGAEDFRIEGVEVICEKWTIETELEQLSKFDIGLPPLLDDEWSRGKCGLKALQYMATGVPVVCSDSGVYRQMITDGLNGFLAKNKEEWTQKLSRLLQDEKLRKQLSGAARKTVEDKYSLKLNAEKLYTHIKTVQDAGNNK
ncbi:MAG: glycosyltransferase family 4 protein [Candidatus Omnitrophica bacterium]|nr:glycosyltransferase family 4 protein [Candidatus Omnitrophota bacterium]